MPNSDRHRRLNSTGVPNPSRHQPISLKSDSSDNKSHVRALSIRGVQISPQGAQLTPLQLKLARTALGLGLRDLAKFAKVATSTIVRFESGKGGMQTGTLDRIQNVLEERGVIFIRADATGGATIRIANSPHHGESRDQCLDG